MRNKYYKYIVGPRNEEGLYNIVADPLEKQNLSHFSSVLIETLRNEFEAELTRKKLVRPPYKMFIMEEHRTVEKMKLKTNWYSSDPL
ncbi:MAG: hypothetical protein Q7S86_02645 [bacterium]|nr:hypothetical protein [bacterium]